MEIVITIVIVDRLSASTIAGSMRRRWRLARPSCYDLRRWRVIITKQSKESI
jgi:hypothetical protein